MDRNELKIQALLEKISQLAATYENQLADFRVEITLLTEELKQYKEAGTADVEAPESEATTD